MLARLVLLGCLAAVFAQSTNPSSQATILKYVFENNGADGYFFDFEQSDGIARTERGVLKNRGTTAEALSVTGRFTYIGDDNRRYTVDYTADENGYRPTFVSP